MKLSQNVTVILTVFIVAGLLVLASTIQQVLSPQVEASQASSTDTISESPSPETETLVTDASPGATVSLQVALDALTVADEKNADDYDRKEFKHWTSAAGSDCDARDAVLKEESNPPIEVDAPCPINSGKWQSLYDGRLFTDPSKLDIDHMVPLAESWRSGAYAWTDEQREAYANDMGDPRSLIAVSAGSNRSKSDQDPDEWLPEDVDYLCTYLADWIAVKYRWDLSLEQSEYDAIETNIADCDISVVLPEKALN